jgi:hypothetical protein
MGDMFSQESPGMAIKRDVICTSMWAARGTCRGLIFLLFIHVKYQFVDPRYGTHVVWWPCNN